MIKTIDIGNFGSFKDFIWRDSMRDSGNNVVQFKRLNILYGRNYSGKTTLSRILRSFQEQKLPENYEKPQFTLTTDSGTFNHTQIASHTHDIRVYNRDFVEENLSFLRDSEGKITPFAIIGSENKEIEEQIAQKETELGSIDTETGVKSKHAKKAAEASTAQTEATKAIDALNEKLRRHANDEVKLNRVYGLPTYNLPSIKADIQKIRTESIAVLTNEQAQERNDLLKEEELPNIEVNVFFTPQLEALYTRARELLTKAITPTEPIQELLNDALLQVWVKTGMAYHREKRKTCGFCRQPLPDNLWRELDAHFSKESSELDEALKTHIVATETESETTKNVFTIQKESFYASKRAAFDESKRALDQEIEAYQSALSAIIGALRARQADIFKPATCPELIDNSGAIAAQISSINDLIAENNEKSKSLTEDKKRARTELRLNDVAQFIKIIDLTAEEEKNQKLVEAADGLQQEAATLKDRLTALEGEIESLKVQQKDER